MRPFIPLVILCFGVALCRPNRNFSSTFLQRRNVEPSNALEQRLDEIHEDLQKIKLALFTQNNKDQLDLRTFKCAAELSNGNELGATKYWQDLQMYLATPDVAKSVATRIIQRVDLEGGKAVLPLIQFFQYMSVPQVYSKLIHKLKETGQFYTPSSFVLAENIKQTCGVEQTIFTSLPQVLRDISGSVVSLKNTFNGGYLYLHNESSNPSTWFSPHKHVDLIHGMSELRKPRGLWEFMLLGDKMKIINVFSGDDLVDSNTLFEVELVNDNEIRIRVAESENTDLIGKYLAGKTRNKGEQLTLAEFLDREDAHIEQLRWTATAGDKRAVPEMAQKCA